VALPTAALEAAKAPAGGGPDLDGTGEAVLLPAGVAVLLPAGVPAVLLGGTGVEERLVVGLIPMRAIAAAAASIAGASVPAAVGGAREVVGTGAGGLVAVAAEASVPVPALTARALGPPAPATDAACAAGSDDTDVDPVVDSVLAGDVDLFDSAGESAGAGAGAFCKPAKGSRGSKRGCGRAVTGA